MSAPTDDDPTTYRLPYTVVPSRYRLTLVPDLAAATFTGEVSIDVTVAEPVTDIVLNAAELTIDSAALTPTEGAGSAGGETGGAGAQLAPSPPPRPPSMPRRNGSPSTFPEPVPAGPATLHLAFTGILNDKLHGFYRSTFTDDDGNERLIATTQMEATDARRAFPCWDEPDRKAVFEVTLVVEEGLSAYSNGPIVEETPEPDRLDRPGPPGPVRRDHAHVHLPGGLHRRPPPGHRPGRRRRRAPPDRPSAGKGPSGPLRARGRGSCPALFHRLLRHRRTRPTSSTWWPFPTSPSAPWRTWAA